MKASLKLREEQNPLFRAKVPLNILGFPFQSGVSLSPGDSKDLSLNLSTFFQSGPSLKLVYKPNDSFNPFNLLLKTGIGPFGSPISTPFIISAEFNLVSLGNPSFFLRFSPQIGDFSIKKSSGSSISQSAGVVPKIKSSSANGVDSDAEEETPLENGHLSSSKRVNGLMTESNGVNLINGLFKGVELNARTVLPIKNRAVIKFRWGVKFPVEIKSGFIEEGIMNPTAAIPFLVMSKIAIEHVTKDDNSKKGNDTKRDLSWKFDVAEDVKRQLEVFHAENRMLRKAIEEVRSEIGVKNSGFVTDNVPENSEKNGVKHLRGKSDGDC